MNGRAQTGDVGEILESPQAIRIVREREVAFDSPDHLMPWGTRRDNSKNPRFNQKLYKLYSGRQRPLKILDLGCSGGGFVKDCIDDGCLAIGLEGSDFSRRYRRAEWRTIPEYLFTCDVTRGFDVLREGNSEPERILFDVVTCWEVIEHFTESGIDGVAENVRKHLLPDGMWIMSVSPNEEVIGGVRLHQTVEGRDWWIRKFDRLGYRHCESVVRYFNTQFVRGPKYGGPGSFILALTHGGAAPVDPPRERQLARLYDRWLGSLPQRFLSRVVTGA